MPIKPEGESQKGPGYFTKQDFLRRYPDLLPPGCTWQGMVARGEVLTPEVLMNALSRAKEVLITEPGPNLYQRQRFAPSWFGYWEGLIGELFGQRSESRPGFTSSERLKPFEKIRDCVAGEESGVLFVAGAEGHYGHVYAAEYMKRRVITIWVFEQDNYFVVKERPAPFLPLEVRLSMWHYFGIDYLAVIPLRHPEVDINTHYAARFQELGVTYCFATDGDPYLEEKIARGKRSSFTTIPRAPVPSTTERVRFLFETGDEEVSALSITELVERMLEQSVS